MFLTLSIRGFQKGEVGQKMRSEAFAGSSCVLILSFHCTGWFSPANIEGIDGEFIRESDGGRLPERERPYPLAICQKAEYP